MSEDNESQNMPPNANDRARVLPNIRKYHESVGREISDVRDRVRNLIGDAHWLSDGEHKEAVLREVLKRHLPGIVGCGTGFIVTPSGPSDQIDILIYDSRKPTLFHQGDFVIVTPDCVKAAIEVKTDKGQLREGIDHLAKLAEQVRDPNLFGSCWTGLFVFEADGLRPRTVLDHLADAANGNDHLVVNCVAAGSDTFARYWDLNDGEPYVEAESGVTPLPLGLQSWHSYDLRALAPAYFIGNVVDAISEFTGDSQWCWFPEKSGKESVRTGMIGLRDKQFVPES